MRKGKECTICFKWFEWSGFNKNRKMKDGFGSNCKGCVSISNRKARERNKERFLLMGGCQQTQEKYRVNAFYIGSSIKHLIVLHNDDLIFDESGKSFQRDLTKVYELLKVDSVAAIKEKYPDGVKLK